MKNMICLIVLLTMTSFPTLACTLDIEGINNDLKKAVTKLFKLPTTVEVRIVKDIDNAEYESQNIALVQEVIWDETFGRNSDPGSSCPDKVIQISKVLTQVGEEYCQGLVKTYPMSNKRPDLIFKNCHKE